MAYTGEISRANPTGFVFVIDQSGSMDEKTESGRSKAQFLSDVLNKTLYTLVTNCSKADGVRNYFDIGVIAYSGAGVEAGFGGRLAGGFIHSIAEISESPIRVEERLKKVDDGAGGVIDQKTKFPIWFDPKSTGGTPMCAALTKAVELLADWCDKHPQSYPPTVLHVTDGQSTDGSPEEVADALKRISTADGACLLFNLHVTISEGGEVLFPSAEQEAPDEHSKMLFRISSVLPEHLTKVAKDKGYSIGEGARGLIYNGDPKAIVDFFEIGTRPKMVADR